MSSQHRDLGPRPSSRRKASHIGDLSPKDTTNVRGGKKKKKPNYDDVIRDGQVSFDEIGTLHKL